MSDMTKREEIKEHVDEGVEVCVLGSLNIDFTAYCVDTDLPLPGQTVVG